jgi:AcrR family transcriptional regulator
VAKATARASLTQAQIVDAALALISEVGVDKLSMRQLSTRLGASLGATYRHVPTKEDLLDLCGRALYDRSYRPRGAEEDPLDWVGEQVLTLYDLLAAHPGMAGYAIQHVNTISPDLAHAVSESLRSAGLSSKSVKTAGLVMTFYIAGALLSDSATTFAAAGVADPKAMLAAGLDFILRGGERTAPDAAAKTPDRPAPKRLGTKRRP